MAADFDANFPYGLDRPALAQAGIAVTFGFGIAALVAVVVLHPGLVVLALLLAFVASMVVTLGVFQTARRGKIRASDRLLDGLDLEGDEDAVDVGCGTGLLCAGLSVRLPRGTVTGVDAWVESQLRPTGKQVARRTLQLAGVKGVRIHTGTVRALALPDRSADVVVSRDVLGLLPGREARAEAVDEMARVLRPGGRVALLEAARTRELTALLTSAGFERVQRTGPWWRLTPPHRLVTARRP